jgi:hypothetical protein
MTFRLSAALAAAAAAAILLGAQAPAQANSRLGINAWDLYEGKVQLKLGQDVRMWECWVEDGAGDTPEILQWVGGKWIFLAKSAAVRNSRHCPSDAPYLARYRFTVEHQGVWNPKKRIYELRVKTQCDTCVTYVWKMPIKGAAP